MSEQAGHLEAEELSAFLDGDLAEGKAPLVREHLKGCPPCRERLEEFRALKSGLGELAEARPEKDLWAGIARQRALEHDRAGRSWWARFWLVPATALLASAATLLLVFWLGGTPPVQNQGTHWNNPAAGPVRALSAVLDAELQYRKAIADLQGSLAGRPPSYSPEVQEKVAGALATIDRAIEQARTAMRSDPTNAETQQTLLAAYQHKVDLLSDLVVQGM